ncbi:MAG: HAMP domain-containing histidine kinase [Bernardetiaceae bacterium]|nr:HAMP domain-containing histidine kinase [Bernardetiaceae bacterium]
MFLAGRPAFGQEYKVNGQLVDRQHRPVGLGQVLIYENAPNRQATRNGKFAVSVAGFGSAEELKNAIEQQLQVRHPRLTRQEVAVEIVGTHQLDLLVTLAEKTPEIAGFVVDDQGMALAGAKVQVVNSPKLAHTSGRGYFALTLPQEVANRSPQFLVNGSPVPTDKVSLDQASGQYRLLVAPAAFVLASQAPPAAEASTQPPAPETGQKSTKKLAPLAEFDQLDLKLKDLLKQIENDQGQVVRNHQLLQNEIKVVMKLLAQNQITPAQKDRLMGYLQRFGDLLAKNEQVFNTLQQQNAQLLTDMQEMMAATSRVREESAEAIGQRDTLQMWILWLLLGLGVFLGLSAFMFFLLRKIRHQKQDLAYKIAQIEAQKAQLATQAQELAQANEEIMSINTHLEELNNHLETLVADRTTSLQQVNNELDTFLYKSSHNMRRPLMSLIGLTNVAGLANHSLEVAGYLDQIKHTVYDLDEMLLKLIAVSEISQGRLAIQPIDLPELTAALATKFAPALEAAQVELVFKPRLHAPPVTDANLLKLILVNLIENGIRFHNRYSLKPQQVTVHLHSHEDHLELTVHDNGRGIEPAYLDQIFNMYYVATSQPIGSGLGLYVVHKAVAKLGGSVAVCSEVEQFTEFRITLPQGHLG